MTNFLELYIIYRMMKTNFLESYRMMKINLRNEIEKVKKSDSLRDVLNHQKNKLSKYFGIF